MGSLGLGAGDVSCTKRLYSDGNRGMYGGVMGKIPALKKLYPGRVQSRGVTGVYKT